MLMPRDDVHGVKWFLTVQLFINTSSPLKRQFSLARGPILLKVKGKGLKQGRGPKARWPDGPVTD